MAKYITRTIVTYNTKVTFVMNGQIDTYKLNGEVGKKEAKKILISVFGNNDIIIVSCEKEEESSAVYKMLEKDFISMATKESPLC
jgi:hypothetical protein